MFIRSVVALFVFLALDTAAVAQQPPRAHLEDGPEVDQPQPPRPYLKDGPEVDQVPQPAAGNGESLSGTRNWTTIEIVLSVAVLLFGTIVFALQTYLVIKLPLEWTPSAILRFNGLTLIITGGILLVTAGYSNQQMAPVIGLLGAIAGYLLGSADKPSKPS